MKEFFSFVYAFFAMSVFATCTTLADEPLTIDQVIKARIGQWTIEVRQHDLPNCRRVFQTIEEQWYVACLDQGQLVVKMEDPEKVDDTRN